MYSNLSRLPGWGVASIAAAAASGALAIFNASSARKAERRNHVGGAFITIDGTKLHYLSRGEGPAIVLLHGNGSMIQDWMISGLIDKLSRNHRVVAFDRPGFGYSERPRTTIWTPEAQADLLAKAVVGLELGIPTVVGHSFGTLVAIALALNHPELIARLVLIGGYYYPTARVDAVLASGPAIPVAGDLMRYTISPVAGKLLVPTANRKLFAPAPVTSEWEEEYPMEMALRPSQIRAVSAEAALMVLAAARLSSRYGELDGPTTIIAGDGDRVVNPQDHSARLNAELSASKLLLVPGAGHMVHHTAATAVRDAILGQAQAC
jgi:pimeloyl-ACP methyl ester carboxylesterase